MTKKYLKENEGQKLTLTMLTTRTATVTTIRQKTQTKHKSDRTIEMLIVAIPYGRRL